MLVSQEPQVVRINSFGFLLFSATAIGGLNESRNLSDDADAWAFYIAHVKHHTDKAKNMIFILEKLCSTEKAIDKLKIVLFHTFAYNSQVYQ